jgi:hypothetical protein
MNYESYCTEFMARVFSFQGNKISVDAKIVKEMVDQYPKYAEKWFFDLPRTAEKEQVETLFPVLAMVAAILSEGHGIKGPANCFHK